MNQTTKHVVVCLGFFLVFSVVSSPGLARAQGRSFIGRFGTVSQIASTVPADGDVNPYGVAVVRRSVGSLVRGNVLVSNFNNGGNLQGTGKTIVQIAPDGTSSVFAQVDSANSPTCPGGIGLTTALVALRAGWVIVGSLPTTDGSASTIGAGCLLILNSRGEAVESIYGGPINGPWDMTAFDADDWAALFVANVLNGTVAANGAVVNQGTVVRINLSIPDEDGDDNVEAPQVLSETVIGSGFAERTDPAALVIGPTGVGLGHEGTLYVADTLNNGIQAIPNALFRQTSAGTGNSVSTGGALNGPLGLAVAPNGDIITANGGDGNMVETTTDGVQVAVKAVDTTQIGAGTLFGLAVVPNHQGVYFVNDGNNTLNLLH